MAGRVSQEKEIRRHPPEFTANLLKQRLGSLFQYSTTAAIIGALLAVIILYMIRRDHLYLRDAIFWLVTAVVSIAFAAFPTFINALGDIAGVIYAPALALGLVCVVLTVKALLSDIALTQMRRDIRQLNQRIALLDGELSLDHAARLEDALAIKVEPTFTVPSAPAAPEKQTPP